MLIMKTLAVRTLVLALCVAAGSVATVQIAAAAEPARDPVKAPTMVDQLPIKSITLYRSGVGSFQRRGTVEGTSTVQLRFDVNQINDILKSMVVLDLSGKGQVGGVSYASRDPLAKRLSSFGVDISDEPSLSTLLVRLRGAKVMIAVPDGKFTGTVIGGEVRQVTSGASPTAISVPFINLLTESGIKSLNLTMASNVEVLDKDLASELHRALAAVAEHRADRIKTVDVNLLGDGQREIMIGYVQESPVWKASYRLVLPKAAAKPDGDDAASAQRLKEQLSMQGWAIIENTTDEDWNNIDLSLVSGQPVSFRMDLYQPLYATRPMVPVPTVPGIAPRIFEGGVPSGLMDYPSDWPADALRRATEWETRELLKEQAASTKPGKPMMVPGRSPNTMAFGGFDGGASGEDMANFAPQSQASAAESGEIFEYRLNHPVTIERQRSAMLPIISDEISGRRVSIWSAADGSKHPMRGLEVRNDSGLELLPGPIAVYDDGTYAGDSQIGHVPAGDKRLLAYSVDLEVDSQVTSEQSSDVQTVRIARGMLELTSLNRLTASYTFANKDARRSRTLIVEHPKRDGWTLKEPAKAYETTDSVYRFAFDVESGKSGGVKIVEEFIYGQQVEIFSTDTQKLMEYRTRGAKVSDQVLEAMRRCAELAAAVRTVETHAIELAREKSAIDTDQARIRQNMSSIDNASPLYAKYLQKLTEQEARVDAIGEASRKAAADIEAARAALSSYIAGLDVE
jgi:hypothetical protein